MVWDPRKHPRDPSGRFRCASLAPGKHMYRGRGGEMKEYWINDMGQMEAGSYLLPMAAEGRVFGSFKDERPLERIHIMGTDDQEQMAVAASDNFTCGVINHDKAAPPEQFSFNRGHEFQPVGNLPEGETAFGGRAAQLTDRKDGKTYDTLNAQLAEKINRQAFDAPDAKPFHADPADFAEGAVQARHEYQRMGFSESDARDMPIYLYAKKNGEIVVKPAYRIDDFGNPVRIKSPNSHGGSGTVMLRGGDVTRMTRAMQREGLDDVTFSISGGTNLNKSGRPLNNALHFRVDNFEHSTTHDQITMWGTIEQHNHGVEKVKSSSAFRDSSGRIDTAKQKEYWEGVARTRDKAAARYRNPTNVQDAAKLIRRKYGSRIDPSQVEMREAGHFAVHTGDFTKVCNSEGKCVATEPYTAEGWRQVANSRLAEGKRIKPGNVQKTEDGYFRVRVTPNPDKPESAMWRYYDKHGKTATDHALRDGTVYRYGDNGELVATDEVPDTTMWSYNR